MKLPSSLRFKKLEPAVAARKQKLQESLQLHQFVFDVDNELQWIKEHLPAAASQDMGKNLIDAQKLHKKHQVGEQLGCPLDSGLNVVQTS